jgi:lipopolysaccharide exporter
MMFTLVAPIGVLFALQADNFVRVALGEAWLPIVPLVWWLAPSVALGVLAQPAYALAAALSRTGILATREALSLGLRLPATIYAAWLFGLLEAAGTRAVASVAITGLFLVVARRLVGAGVRQQLVNCWRAFVAVAAMAVAVSVCGALLPHPQDTFQAAVALVALCALGVCVYALSLLLAWHLAGRPDGAESFVLARMKPWLVR